MSAASARPFADNAVALAALGLAVIPCPANDGKSPQGAVRGFDKWDRPPGPDFIKRLVERCGSANIGVVTSASNVTVVDVDGDENLVERMLDRCGSTPLITSTPSGGRHLWYRSSGERNANLRGSGLNVDIKGKGAGIVIVPPSVRPSTGVSYGFVAGDWDDLLGLPTIRGGTLPQVQERAPVRHRPSVGTRNEALFRLALHDAHACDDFAALLDVVGTRNDELEQPLPTAEVRRLTHSAWGYETSGRNWSGRESRSAVTKSAFENLMEDAHGPDGLSLLIKLRQEHSVRKEPFAIAAKSMAEANALNNWGVRRFRTARDLLLRQGHIRRVVTGGRGKNDPSLYLFP